MTIIDQDKMLTDSFLKLSQLNALGLIEVVQTYSDASDFLENHQTEDGFIVFDINTKGIEWREFIEETKQKFPTNKLIVLTKYESSEYVKQAFIEGVDAYISKKDSLSGLQDGMEQVLKGEKYHSPHLSISPKLYPAGYMHEKAETTLPDSFEVKQKLSSREIEVLKGIVSASSTKEIADQLFISEQTVAVHKKNIMKKMKVNNTIGLIKTAFENGLIEN